METHQFVREIDEILNAIDTPEEAQCSLLREHLETARQYVLGAMPKECAANLKLADEALDCVSDGRLRHRIGERLNQLLREA